MIGCNKLVFGAKRYFPFAKRNIMSNTRGALSSPLMRTKPVQIYLTSTPNFCIRSTFVSPVKSLPQENTESRQELVKVDTLAQTPAKEKARKKILFDDARIKDASGILGSVETSLIGQSEAQEKLAVLKSSSDLPIIEHCVQTLREEMIVQLQELHNKLYAFQTSIPTQSTGDLLSLEQCNKTLGLLRKKVDSFIHISEQQDLIIQDKLQELSTATRKQFQELHTQVSTNVENLAKAQQQILSNNDTVDLKSFLSDIRNEMHDSNAKICTLVDNVQARLRTVESESFDQRTTQQDLNAQISLFSNKLETLAETVNSEYLAILLRVSQLEKELTAHKLQFKQASMTQKDEHDDITTLRNQLSTYVEANCQKTHQLDTQISTLQQKVQAKHNEQIEAIEMFTSKERKRVEKAISSIREEFTANIQLRDNALRNTFNTDFLQVSATIDSLREQMEKLDQFTTESRKEYNQLCHRVLNNWEKVLADTQLTEEHISNTVQMQIQLYNQRNDTKFKKLDDDISSVSELKDKIAHLQKEMEIVERKQKETALLSSAEFISLSHGFEGRINALEKRISVELSDSKQAQQEKDAQIAEALSIVNREVKSISNSCNLAISTLQHKKNVFGWSKVIQSVCVAFLSFGMLLFILDYLWTLGPKVFFPPS